MAAFVPGAARGIRSVWGRPCGLAGPHDASAPAGRRRPDRTSHPALRATDKARDDTKSKGPDASRKRAAAPAAAPSASAVGTEGGGGGGLVAGVLRGVFRERINATTTAATKPITTTKAAPPSSDRTGFLPFPRLLGRNATNATATTRERSDKRKKGKEGKDSGIGIKKNDQKDASAAAERGFWRGLWRRQQPEEDRREQPRDRDRERSRGDPERKRTSAPTTSPKNDEARRRAARNGQERVDTKRRGRDGAAVAEKKEPEGAPWPLAALGLVGNGTVANRTKASNETASSNPFAVFSRLFNGTAPANATAKTTNGTSSGGSPLTGIQRFFSSSSSLLLSAAAGSNKEEWVTVLPKTRLMPGVIVPVTVAGLDLLVVASKDGRRLYAIENSCSHLGTPLETGQLVRLPIESDAPPPAAASASASTSPPDDQLPAKLSGAFNGPWSETDVSNMLQQDGCEDCIVCPLHRTAFALQSGAVRGEWCPYPPVLGKLIGNIKAPTGIAVFDIRTRGKNVEVRINTPITIQDEGNND